MPRNNLREGRTWNLRKAKPEEWCSAFWPGILWMAFDYNKSEAVNKAAIGYTEAIAPIINSPVFDHDLRFIAINSFLKGYEVTKNEHYKQLALQAADSLITLFTPTVGTILSWPRHVKDYGGHNTIMDNMMNLELLFWADKERHSQTSNLYDIAVRHADTTMKNHFRPDGSCYHVAVYDTLTGKFIKGVTHQGYADYSMWSRGQAWAIYGYTMVYRYTKNKRFLDFAQKVTDIYLKRLHETSDDMVPIWDMDDSRGIAAPKDASAACVVASALLELCQYVKDGDRYWLSKEEERALMEHNLAYQRMNGLGEMLMAIIQKPRTSPHTPSTEPDEGDELWITISELSALLKSHFKGYKEDASTFQKIGAYLNRPEYKFLSKRTNHGVQYKVKRKV